MSETTWDQSKFNETLAEYSHWTKRTHKQIVDTKAYYVARKALWFTTKADSFKIKHQLGGFIMVARVNKKGKTVNRRQVQLVMGTKVDAPLAALIINKRRGKAGEPGLQGARMARAVRELLAARMRSIAFYKSGWLPAIKLLAPLADRKGEPQTDRAAKQVGRPKGDATPATEGENPAATIVNMAGSARGDTKGAFMKYAGEGLQIAMADEQSSMDEYIEQKMAVDAERFNRAQE